jgi:hypothetical protein
VLRQQTFDAIAAEQSTTLVRKQRIRWLTSQLMSPGGQNGNGVTSQGRTTLLPALPLAPHMCTCPEHKILTTEANQLGDPQSCLDCQEQERSIATTVPSGEIRSGQECVDLGASQELDRSTIVALAGHGQNPLDESTVRWLRECREPEERANGGKPCVATTRAAATCLLQMIEKAPHKRRVDVLEGEHRRGFLQLLLREVEET